MGLKSDIKNAVLKSMDFDKLPSDKSIEAKAKKNINKKIDVLAKDLSEAIITFIEAQTFRITKMKAPLQVEEISTNGPMKLDLVAPMVGVPNTGGPVIFAPNASPLTPMPITFGNVNLSKTTGKSGGGPLKALGNAYVGQNPIDKTSDSVSVFDSEVKLLPQDTEDK